MFICLLLQKHGFKCLASVRHWQYRDNMKFHLEIVPGSVTSGYFLSFISHHFLQLPPTLLLLLLSLQSCPTLRDPTDGSPPGSPVPGNLLARTLEWVAISFCSAWKWKVKVKSLSLVPLFATPWTAVHQAPLPMGFSRQEHWSGVPLPSLSTDLTHTQIPTSYVPATQTFSLSPNTTPWWFCIFSYVVSPPRISVSIATH